MRSWGDGHVEGERLDCGLKYSIHDGIARGDRETEKQTDAEILVCGEK